MTRHTQYALTGPNSFRKDASGGISTLFAFTIMLLLVTSGVAIDLSNAKSEEKSMQSAVDAAALAAALTGSDDPTVQSAVGESFFKANYSEHASVNVSVAVNAGTVKVAAEKVYDTKILSIVGINSVPISVFAEVPVVSSGQAEVVLVLDYSDSMLDNNKYVRLKDAAHQMIDELSKNGTNTNIKFGIVPFAALVRADLPASYVRSDVVYNGCTQDRRFPSNTEETAGIDDDSKWGEITSGHDCGEMDAAGLKVVPLTSDVDLVKSKLNAMVPHLWTHIALGAEFGRQILSPAGPFANASAYKDSGTVKVFVLLTDGMQTAPGWGPGQSQSAVHGEKNLLSICAGLKQQDIQVYTVGYDLTDNATLSLLETCASPGNFYDAKDVGNGLIASFNAITKKITSELVRLSK